jgi:hypothetical protein
MLKEFCSHANWLAIIVAAVVYFIIGALWYSLLFRKPWMAGHNIQMPTEPEAVAKMKKQMPVTMIIGFVMNVVMAIVVGVCVMRFGSGFSCMAGIKLGLLLSAIAVIPLLMSHMYMMKPLKVWTIDGGYHVVGITVISIIISVWHK